MLEAEDTGSTSRTANDPTARLFYAAGTGFTRRKQVAICSSAWPDWLIISKLEYVQGQPGQPAILKAVQASGQHLNAEIFFEASTLKAVRVF